MSIYAQRHHNGGDSLYSQEPARLLITDYEALPQGVWYTHRTLGDNSGGRLRFWNNGHAGGILCCAIYKIGCVVHCDTRQCIRDDHSAAANARKDLELTAVSYEQFSSNNYTQEYTSVRMQ